MSNSEEHIDRVETLLGPRKAELERAVVGIIGLGSLGSRVAMDLGQFGVGHFHLIDQDIIEAANISTHPGLSSEDHGSPKVSWIGERLEQQFDCVTSRYPATAELNLLEEVCYKCDIVVDCLDNQHTRRLLAIAAKRARIPLVHGAVAGWLGEVCIFYPEGKQSFSALYPSDHEGLSCDVAGMSPSTLALVAGWQTQLVSQFIIGNRPSSQLVRLDGNEGWIEILELPHGKEDDLMIEDHEDKKDRKIFQLCGRQTYVVRVGDQYDEVLRRLKQQEYKLIDGVYIGEFGTLFPDKRLLVSGKEVEVMVKLKSAGIYIN